MNEFLNRKVEAHVACERALKLLDNYEVAMKREDGIMPSHESGSSH